MNYAIIAAGQGSRLVQEGVQKPKPLVELNGEPMIARLIRIFAENNAESISVIVNEEMTEVKALLDTLNPGCELNVVVKTTPSSMHSFYELSRVMKPGKFCLTTVDTVFKEKDFASYVRAFDEDTDNDGMMAVTPFIDDEKPLFVETDEQNSIKAFLDEHADGVKYVSGGVYALNEKAVRVLEECMANGMSRMRNFQRGLIAAGLKLKAYPIEKIVDVDHANDIETAERFISE
ncbi:MAG: NTP transferase domain-containing protein [Muribaculaceae bacterium]|nr:NTP transferase domain-containing protein [Muribaculaceae bacterium]MEE1298780.1 NTP transferase domain-containing protein [Muribaculaceae bacterium]